MTKIFQFGLAVEAALNVFGASFFLTYPEHGLAYAVLHTQTITTPEPYVAPSTAVLWQIYGALVLSLTVPIVLCIPEKNRPWIAEQRSLLFKTLTAGEVLIVSVLLWHIFTGTETSTGFSTMALYLSTAFLMPALSWHLFALYGASWLLEAEAAETVGKTKAT